MSDIHPDRATAHDHVTLTDHATGKSYDLPVYKGSMGPRVIDIQSLYRETGMFTFDPGYMSTGSCESQITFIDGDKGQLLHRGYTIEDLAEHSTYLEVCYLLIYGHLPNRKELDEWVGIVANHTMLHEQLLNFFHGFRRDAHPMAIMVGVIGALSAFYHDNMDINSPTQRMIATHRLVAKMPTIAAHAYKYSVGQPFMYPQNEMSYAENFLYMTFGTPTMNYEVKPAVARAMDRIFILHADHEQNASTSTVRIAGSSMANPFACIAAGTASLWGPAHGGANEQVLKMLGEIGNKNNIPEYLKKARDPDDPFRLFGFGHRVYKNYDPRAGVLRGSAHEVLNVLGVDDPLLELAMELESIALADEYFVKRKLFPNVDFYSGIILKAIGFPVSMFTVLFALARSIGWIAQWKEMIETPDHRIARPRQLYTGATPRAFEPIDERED